MLRTGNRKVKIKKANLLERIQENKAKHIEAYEKAVKAYKLEALEQLEKLTKKANDGDLDLKLDLVTPIDNSSDYDQIHELFEWEIEEEIELTQEEFRQYVQDENDFAQQASFANTFYSSKFRDI